MFKNFTVFQIHTPNKIASMYFGGAYFKYEGHYPDSDIKNYLLTAYAKDEVYTNKITLPDMIAEAKKYTMKLVIGMNESHGEDNPLVTPEVFGRAAGILADILIENGFNNETAGLNLINEPKERWNLHWTEYVQYIRAADKYVKGRLPLIIYNEEVHFFPSQTGFGIKDILNAIKDIPKDRIIIGVHHLSSLGYPPKWQNVIDAKTIANGYERPVMCNEGGSWFKSYREEEGHNINIKLMKRCKETGYVGFGICLNEVNEAGHNMSNWNNLGYRIWDNNYTKILSQTNWDKFENELKKYKNKPEEFEEEDDMKLEQFYYKGKVSFPNDNGRYGVKFLQLCFGLKPTGVMDSSFDNTVRNYQSQQHILVDGIVGPQTFNEIYKSLDNVKLYGLVHSYWARKIIKFYEED